jgi:hypothetical protein
MSIEKVGGNVLLQRVSGAAEFGKIGGDVRAEGITELSVAKAGGNIQAEVQSIAGPIQAGGDIQMKVTGIGSSGADLKAGGDITLLVDPGISVNLAVDSGADEISIRVGNQLVNLEEGSFQGVLGAGGPLLRLDAGGTVQVSDAVEGDVDLEHDFGVDFTSLQQNMDRLSEHAARISDAASRKVDEAVRHAEKRMQHAMRTMERKMPGMVGNIPAPDRPASPGQASASAISNEERMAVLKMLQEKKISLEQAEKLLSVLEGRS